MKAHVIAYFLKPLFIKIDYLIQKKTVISFLEKKCDFDSRKKFKKTKMDFTKIRRITTKRKRRISKNIQK